MTFTKLRKSWINKICLIIGCTSICLILFFSITLLVSYQLEFFKRVNKEGSFIELPIELEIEPIDESRFKEGINYDSISDVKVHITKVEKNELGEGRLTYNLEFNCYLASEKNVNYNNSEITEYKTVKINDELIEQNKDYNLSSGNYHIEVEAIYVNNIINNGFRLPKYAFDSKANYFSFTIDYSEEIKENFFIKEQSEMFFCIPNECFTGFPYNTTGIIEICGGILFLFVIYEIVIIVGSKKEKKRKEQE